MDALTVCAPLNNLFFFPSTESLSDNATAFSNRAKQLRRQMWWRGCKVSKNRNRWGGFVEGLLPALLWEEMEKLCFLTEKML